MLHLVNLDIIQKPNISVLNNSITVKDVQLVPINLSSSLELIPNNDILKLI